MCVCESQNTYLFFFKACSQGWSGVTEPLECWDYTYPASLYGSRHWAQGFVHTGQALDQHSCIPSPQTQAATSLMDATVNHCSTVVYVLLYLSHFIALNTKGRNIYNLSNFLLCLCPLLLFSIWVFLISLYLLFISVYINKCFDSWLFKKKLPQPISCSFYVNLIFSHSGFLK